MIQLKLDPAELRAYARIFLTITDGETDWTKPDSGLTRAFEALGPELVTEVLVRYAEIHVGVVGAFEQWKAARAAGQLQ